MYINALNQHKFVKTYQSYDNHHCIKHKNHKYVDRLIKCFKNAFQRIAENF